MAKQQNRSASKRSASKSQPKAAKVTVTKKSRAPKVTKAATTPAPVASTPAPVATTSTPAISSPACQKSCPKESCQGCCQN